MKSCLKSLAFLSRNDTFSWEEGKKYFAFFLLPSSPQLCRLSLAASIDSSIFDRELASRANISTETGSTAEAVVASSSPRAQDEFALSRRRYLVILDKLTKLIPVNVSYTANSSYGRTRVTFNRVASKSRTARARARGNTISPDDDVLTGDLPDNPRPTTIPCINVSCRGDCRAHSPRCRGRAKCIEQYR